LNYCFKIPVLGFVSLRGEVGIPDEPQHELMGQITTDLLDTMRIAWAYLAQDLEDAKAQLKNAQNHMEKTQLPFFFVVKKGSFEKVAYKVPETKVLYTESAIEEGQKTKNMPNRQACLDAIVEASNAQTVLLATTGKTGRELFETKDSERHFYQVGSMGCISAIGLGIAVSNPRVNCIVVDGDGAALMRLGNLPTLGHYKPKNLLHILLDNGVHDSTGGQDTVSNSLHFAKIAEASGYPNVKKLYTELALKEAIIEWKNHPCLTFIHVPIAQGSKEGLGRPTVKPIAVKQRFMEALARG
jgi:phosphonopyruvate decarboxylase